VGRTKEGKAMLAHISVGVNDLVHARAFYEPVMAALGARELYAEGPSVAYGRKLPELWIGLPFDGKPAHPGNGVHVCLLATTEQAVRDFHAAALAHGGSDDGGPGLRPEYLPNYYAAFVRDPDGNKLEALHYVQAGG
jgi:catechol 2,3-dioxygenase-like lactoylglutathione lyase family enzyme